MSESDIPKVEEGLGLLKPDDPEMDRLAFSAEELINDVDNINLVDYIKMQRYVCLCGHSLKCHHPKAVVPYCLPGRRQCHCPQFNPVLETTNLRVFKRFSKGNGTLHALAQGIRALMEKGGTYKWIPEACFCYKCKRADVKILPAVVTPTGYRVEFKEKDNALTERVDIFLCEDCNFLLVKNGTIRGEA